MIAYDMSVGYGECQFAQLVDIGDPDHLVPVRCTNATRGLVVYAPINDHGTVLRLATCPLHLDTAWEMLGKPRGLPRWEIAEPALHERDEMLPLPPTRST